MAELRQVSSGLLARHQSDDAAFPFVAAHWAAADIAVSVVAACLRFTDIGAAGTIYVPNIVMPARARWMVQALTRMVGSGAAHGPLVRMEEADPANDFVVAHVSTGFNGPQGIREFVAGAVPTSNTTTLNIGAPNVRTSLWVDGADAAMQNAYAGTRAIVLSAGETVGRAGLQHSRGSAGSTECTHYWAMGDRYVRVIGLEAGWSAQVLNAADAVLFEASEAGGVALVDLFTAVFPQPAKLRILDETDAVVATMAPAALVWGGDVYEWAGDASGDLSLGGLTVTASVDRVHTPASAALELAGLTVTAAATFRPAPPPFTELSLVAPNVGLIEPIALTLPCDGLIIRPQPAPVAMRSLLPALPARTQ